MKIHSRRRHRLVGLVLFLPFIAWSCTAVFFLVRPRYEQAYERLEVKQYPLTESFAETPDPSWLELRTFRTVLGNHLLVRQGDRWQHLNLDSRQPWQRPDDSTLTRLLEDAFTANAQRYGSVRSIAGDSITTSTGVNIDMDWQTLSFQQQGRDTRWINRIYSIHYLQWTGIGWIDQTVGLSGLVLLIYMTYSGARLSMRVTPEKVRGSKSR